MLSLPVLEDKYHAVLEEYTPHNHLTEEWMIGMKTVLDLIFFFICLLYSGLNS